MAEAGGPSIAEVQAQPVGVVDGVKSKLREVLTPQGRAEVMAQKQIDSILAQVPEDKRVEAMQILESKRPEFVAGKMDAAKGSLVRDAVIGTAVVVGTVGGVAFAKREAIINAAFSIGVPVEKGFNKALGARDRVIKMRKANFIASIQKATDPVKGFIDGMRLWPFNKLDVNPPKVVPTVTK